MPVTYSACVSKSPLFTCWVNGALMLQPHNDLDKLVYHIISYHVITLFKCRYIYYYITCVVCICVTVCIAIWPGSNRATSWWWMYAMVATMGPTPAVLLVEIAHRRWKQLATHWQLHVSYAFVYTMHVESTAALFGMNGGNKMWENLSHTDCCKWLVQVYGKQLVLVAIREFYIL